MRTINVLATQRISADDRAKIEASDPEIRLIDAGGWFDGEIARPGPPSPRHATCRQARPARAAARSATASSPRRK
jgi:hypothetical protein